MPVRIKSCEEKRQNNLVFKDVLKRNLIYLHPDEHEIIPSPCQLPKPDNIPSDFWSDYSELFSNQPGCLPITYKMTLDPYVPPVVKPPQSIPHAMREKSKNHLTKWRKRHHCKSDRTDSRYRP